MRPGEGRGGRKGPNLLLDDVFPRPHGQHRRKHLGSIPRIHRPAVPFDPSCITHDDGMPEPGVVQPESIIQLHPSQRHFSFEISLQDQR